MAKILDYLLGKKTEDKNIEIPAEPSIEEAWLTSNFVFRWLERLKYWGMDAEDYKKERAKSKKQSDEEIALLLYNKLIVKHKNEPLILQSLYYELGMMNAELDRDPGKYLKLANDNIITHFKSVGDVNGVVIQNVDRHSCPGCKKNDGWILTFDQVKKQHPLPNRKCTKKHVKKSFCRCTYGPMKGLR